MSRTGGLSATKTFSGDGYGATINTNHGVRLHKRLFKGARMGFQTGTFNLLEDTQMDHLILMYQKWC